MRQAKRESTVQQAENSQCHGEDIKHLQLPLAIQTMTSNTFRFLYVSTYWAAVTSPSGPSRIRVTFSSLCPHQDHQKQYPFLFVRMSISVDFLSFCVLKSQAKGQKVCLTLGCCPGSGSDSTFALCSLGKWPFQFPHPQMKAMSGKSQNELAMMS